jgi:hypothetical protein
MAGKAGLTVAARSCRPPGIIKAIGAELVEPLDIETAGNHPSRPGGPRPELPAI